MIISKEDQDRLTAVAAKFASFRRERGNKRGRIPEALWREAEALALAIPPSRVAKSLGLDSLSLKRRLGRPKPCKIATVATSDMIRVAPVIFNDSSVQSKVALEIIFYGGVRLNLASPSVEMLEMVVGQILRAKGGVV